MKTKEIKKLLQKYFEGESSLEEERILQTYFTAGNVAEELSEYAGFFGGIAQLAKVSGESEIENEVMDHILENEHREKTRFRQMWQMVTGVAAAIIIVMGGFLIFQEQQKPFADTYKNPDRAYEVAAQTLQFVSEKYSTGMDELSNFGKIEKAAATMQLGVEPVNEFFERIEGNKNQKQTPNSSRLENREENGGQK